MKYTLFGKPWGKMVHYEFNIPRSLSHKTDATHVTLGTNQLEYESSWVWINDCKASLIPTHCKCLAPISVIQACTFTNLWVFLIFLFLAQHYATAAPAPEKIEVFVDDKSLLVDPGMTVLQVSNTGILNDSQLLTYFTGQNRAFHRLKLFWKTKTWGNFEDAVE